MLKKLVLLLVLLATSVFISGCIFDKKNNPVAVPKNNTDFILQSNLPSGFTYMGTHETELTIDGVGFKAIEGVYRYNYRDDAYIHVIENYSPEALIARYKSVYKKANYNPFEEISFNGHAATKITDYATIRGEQKPHYTIIWQREKFVILVSSLTEDAQLVKNLAAATGY